MDTNFIQQDTVAREEVDWYDARKLTLYGLIPEQELVGRRLPKEIAEVVNNGVLNCSAYSASGRLRFLTDPPFLALEVRYGPGQVPTVTWMGGFQGCPYTNTGFAERPSVWTFTVTDTPSLVTIKPIRLPSEKR